MFSVICLLRASSSPQVRFILFWPGLSPLARRVLSDQVTGHLQTSWARTSCSRRADIQDRYTGHWPDLCISAGFGLAARVCWGEAGFIPMSRSRKQWSAASCYLDNWRWMRGWRGADERSAWVCWVGGGVGSRLKFIVGSRKLLLSFLLSGLWT
jgi:hypothetical protein